MAKKFYVVRKGFQQGIFYSWDDCQKAIRGYSGAEFKGFNDEAEAEAYFKGREVGVCDSGSVIIEKPSTEYDVNIYTDGSYKDGDVSFGVYIESVNKTFGFHGVVSCPAYASIANIAGEIFGVLVGVQLAIDMGFVDLNIIYDYQGLEKWYTGEWNSNGALQQIYVTLLNNLRVSNSLHYNFIKVKGHSNVSGNKKADKLALRGRTFKDYVDLNAILRGILTVKDVSFFNI